MNTLTKLLDKVASSLEDKGFLLEAREIDRISNTIEKTSYESSDISLIKKLINRKNQDGSFFKIIRFIKKDLSNIYGVRRAVQELKGKTPQESFMYLVKILGGNLDRSLFEKAKKRISQREEKDLGREEKDLGSGNVVEAASVSGTAGIGYAVVLLGLVSAVAGKTIEALEYNDVKKIIRAIASLIKKDPNIENVEGM